VAQVHESHTSVLQIFGSLAATASPGLDEAATFASKLLSNQSELLSRTVGLSSSANLLFGAL
jgi:hypothetical protein